MKDSQFAVTVYQLRPRTGGTWILRTQRWLIGDKMGAQTEAEKQTGSGEGAATQDSLPAASQCRKLLLERKPQQSEKPP